MPDESNTLVLRRRQRQKTFDNKNRFGIRKSHLPTNIRKKNAFQCKNCRQDHFNAALLVFVIRQIQLGHPGGLFVYYVLFWIFIFNRWRKCEKDCEIKVIEGNLLFLINKKKLQSRYCYFTCLISNYIVSTETNIFL